MFKNIRSSLEVIFKDCEECLLYTNFNNTKYIIIINNGKKFMKFNIIALTFFISLQFPSSNSTAQIL